MSMHPGLDAPRRSQRWLPAPIMSALVFVTWLLLNQSLSLGHLALAALLALVVPWFTERFRPERPRLRRPGLIVRLGLLVLYDIVKSNIEVTRRVLGPVERIRPAFVWVPLTIRDPHGIYALAGIITMTPGTLSADLSDDHRFLLVHALSVDDPQALVADIKARYEAPLLEIFS
ncbi:MAG: Na+/H+ antiporter subunit E [Betaproteobacteria bacterium]|jgi:multicomponent K+:H+ antiporter subunit E